MPTAPSATTTLAPTAGAQAGGLDYVCVIAPTFANADGIPRVMTSAKSVIDFHGYCEGAEYVALHAAATRKAFLFCGIPVAIPGVIGQEDTSGNTGTSASSLALGGSGALAEHDGHVACVTGGTIGTSQIVLAVSLNKGRNVKRVRLGTATSYTIPYTGVTISFKVGTLVAGDVLHTWHATAPMWDAAGIALARAGLAAQTKQCRSWLVVSDCQDSDDADAVVSNVNAYETENERFNYARVSVRDFSPGAIMGDARARMTPGATVTFAEVGASADTITRTVGSFITDGFVTGDLLVIDGSVSNDQTTATKITVTSATVLTLDTDALEAEGPVAATLTAYGSLTFANSGDTITRNRGSWIADGFKVGDTPTITGTASATNDIAGTHAITTLSATVMTLASGGVTADEVIGMHEVEVSFVQSKTAWVTASEAEYDGISDEERIDLALGRGSVLSPISGYRMRRSIGWAASVREYQHDLHTPCWRVSDGSLSGWTLNNAEGSLFEFDQRVDGGGLEAQFTCATTFANGSTGPFVAMSVTRADEDSLLSRTHNMAVVNLAMQVNQAVTQDFIGSSLTLNNDGTATRDALATLERINIRSLERALRQDLLDEGPRCSSVTWEASTDDVLNVPGATLTGVLHLLLNGTLEHINTSVRVQSGG